MSRNGFAWIFHLAVLALFLVSGLRHYTYQVVSVDELHPILTARNMLQTGSLYLTAGNLAVYNARYAQYPLPISRSLGRAYSFRAALPAVPLAALIALGRPLAACHNLLALAIMLWVLHRLCGEWRVPAGRYYLAALALTFGSCAAAHWFTYFSYPLAGALLALLVYSYQRYCLGRRLPNLLLAALTLAALIMARQEMVIIALVPLAAISWQYRRNRRIMPAAAVALGAALMVGVGHNLAFNWLNAGALGNNGQGELSWSANGLWRWLLEPNENPWVVNPWLLLLFTDWRKLGRARHYLLTALAAWLLYSCWWGWDSGYLRQLVPAVMLATPLLLLTPVRGFVLFLLALGLLFNAAYFYVPYFDLFAALYFNDNYASEMLEPLQGLRLLAAQAAGWWGESCPWPPAGVR